jgi:hypothetical protein
MKDDPPNPGRVHRLIDELSEEHVLKRSPATYIDGFVRAALDVYDSGKLYKVLQEKFFIPTASQYKDEIYFQSASELTVAHHIKKRQVSDFEIQKRVNAENKKDVDVFFRVKSTNVAIEVKCPFEEEPAPYPGTITIQRAGRTRGTDETYEQIKETLESKASGTKFERGKNRDHRLKDCLISAHQKFSSESGLERLNILFLSCGHFYRMGEWYGCLYGRHELFTAESFQAPETYSKVDVVILSNVKYRHQHARNYPAWTLDDVLLLPVVNPRSGRRLLTQPVEEGLSVFDHYLKDFARPQIISAIYHPIDSAVDAMTQVNYFVQERLTGDERARFFPVSLNLNS